MNRTFYSLLAILIIPLAAPAIHVNSKCGVPLHRAIDDARAVAERNDQWEVMLGDGQSMTPYYGAGSVLLVERAPFDELRPGMMVVFRDEAGDLVGHWLVRRENGQWITQGVNNGAPDPRPLIESAYQGVIFGVLRSSGPDATGLAHAANLGLPRVIGKCLR